jgi:hypothetical protein
LTAARDVVALGSVIVFTMSRITWEALWLPPRSAGMHAGCAGRGYIVAHSRAGTPQRQAIHSSPAAGLLRAPRRRVAALGSCSPAACASATKIDERGESGKARSKRGKASTALAACLAPHSVCSSDERCLAECGPSRRAHTQGLQLQTPLPAHQPVMSWVICLPEPSATHSRPRIL